MMRHFIRVYTIHCILQRQNCFYLEIKTCDPSIDTMDHPKFIVSNQKNESLKGFWYESKTTYCLYYF